MTDQPPTFTVNDPAERAERSTRLVAAFYAALAALGLGLILWRKESFSPPPLAPPGPDWASRLLVTLGILAAAHLATRLAHRHLASIRRGADDMIRLLGTLSLPQVAFVALASGVAEEIFFRGYLMHETGVWVSSVLFGLVHWPPNRNWIYWPFFAAAMGFVMAWLYLWSASLLFPVLLHVGINFLNLRLALAKGQASST